MRLKDLGEFKLIQRLTKNIKAVGDDAAVLKYTKDKYLLFTTDMLVENRHFLRKHGGYLIGRKSLSVNISDIASMGGVPTAFVVSLGAPATLEVKFVDDLYRGIKDVAEKFKVDLVGGDTVGVDDILKQVQDDALGRNGKRNFSRGQIIVNISLLGEVEKKNLVLRSGAKKGDAIFVTGNIGGASKTKHLNFTPRLKEARFLVKNFKVHSMIDVSDGLYADLRHILDMSKVGAVIYEGNLPISKKEDLRQGEDFELVFTISARDAGRLEKVWPFKTALSRIGEIRGKKKVEPVGYSHF